MAKQGKWNEIPKKKEISEDELINKLQMFGSVLDSTDEGFALGKIILNEMGEPIDCIFILANNTFKKNLKIKHVQAVGKKASQIFPDFKGFSQKWLKLYGEVAINEKPVKLEEYSPLLGIWFEASVSSPQKDYFIVIFKDITSRKQIEEKLRESESNFKTILEVFPEGAFLIDPQGNIITANQVLANRFDRKVDEIVGLNIYDLLPEEVSKRRREVVEQSIKTKEPINYVDKRDGLYIKSYVHPILNEKEEVIKVAVTAEDITDRKKAQIELRESEEELARAQHIAHIGSYKWDILTDDVKWSDESYRLLGMIPGEEKPNYKLFLRLIVPEDREKVSEAVKRSIDTGENFTVTYNVIGKDDIPRIILSQNEVIKDESGNVIKIYGTNQDITRIKKAEEELSYVNERLNIASQAARIGIWDWNIKTGHIEWSPVMFELLGLEPENKASFEAWNKALHPEDIEIAQKRIQRAIEDHTPLDSEYRIIKPDGQVRWINALGETEYDREGNPLWMIGICIDITERKKAEEELRKAYMYNRGLIEASLDPLVTIGPDGKITDVNSATEHITGYYREEIIGTYFSDYFVDSKKAKEGYKTVLKDGIVQDYELEIKHKEGYTTPISYNASVYRDENGEVIGVFAAARDITERKIVERTLKDAQDTLELKVKKRTMELRRSRASFKTLAENSPDIINRIDKEFKTVYINPAIIEISGKPPEHFIGKSLDKLGIPEEFTVPLKEKSIKAFKTSEIQEFETEMPTIKGLKIFYTYLAPEFDENGEVNTVFTVSHDITELKKAEKQLKDTINELERSNEELQSFAYITSHDLQEPLRTMGNYAGLLKRRYDGQLDEDADDFLNFMEAGAARMKDMIQGLLDYSRVGTRGGAFSKFNMEDTLNHALYNLHSAIEECNAEVTHDPLPEIVGDENQITRVFQNLISNALKFRKKGITPKIHVSAQKEAHEYVFSVSDNGIGLEEEYSDRIFEVFKRLHSIGKYQGAGIGLAIVKRIIDRHRGNIWVESELGKGSTFYFTIPLKITND